MHTRWPADRAPIPVVMMSDPRDYRLVFMLPPVFAFSVPPGRHQPCIAGCMLRITELGQVEITGPSRHLVFEQASRFLRIIGRGHAPVTIGAVVHSPERGDSRRGRDSWTIAVNAKVAFAPTAMPIEMFDVPDLQTELTKRAG